MKGRIPHISRGINRKGKPFREGKVLCATYGNIKKILIRERELKGGAKRLPVTLRVNEKEDALSINLAWEGPLLSGLESLNERKLSREGQGKTSNRDLQIRGGLLGRVTHRTRGRPRRRIDPRTSKEKEGTRKWTK